MLISWCTFPADAGGIHESSIISWQIPADAMGLWEYILILRIVVKRVNGVIIKI